MISHERTKRERVLHAQTRADMKPRNLCNLGTYMFSTAHFWGMKDVTVAKQQHAIANSHQVQNVNTVCSKGK